MFTIQWFSHHDNTNQPFYVQDKERWFPKALLPENFIFLTFQSVSVAFRSYLHAAVFYNGTRVQNVFLTTHDVISRRLCNWSIKFKVVQANLQTQVETTLFRGKQITKQPRINRLITNLVRTIQKYPSSDLEAVKTVPLSVYS